MACIEIFAVVLLCMCLRTYIIRLHENCIRIVKLFFFAFWKLCTFFDITLTMFMHRNKFDIILLPKILIQNKHVCINTCAYNERKCLVKTRHFHMKYPRKARKWHSYDGNMYSSIRCLDEYFQYGTVRPEKVTFSHRTVRLFV